MATNSTEPRLFPFLRLPRELRNLVYQQFWDSLRADGIAYFHYPLRAEIYFINMRPSVEPHQHSSADTSEHRGLPHSILANCQMRDEAMKQLLLDNRVEMIYYGVHLAQQPYTVGVFNLLLHVEELYARVHLSVRKSPTRLGLAEGSNRAISRQGHLLKNSTTFKNLRLLCTVDPFWEHWFCPSAADPINLNLLFVSSFGNKLDLIEVNLRTLKGEIPIDWKASLRGAIVRALEDAAFYRGERNALIHEKESLGAICMYQKKRT